MALESQATNTGCSLHRSRGY